jgi:hypothetical protein
LNPVARPSRRRLLIACVLALLVGAAVWVVAETEERQEPAPPAPQLAKGISFGGPAPLVREGHPNDYRLYGNRDYVRNESGTDWVKLWVSWPEAQGEEPVSREASLAALESSPALRELDDQIRAVQRDSASRRETDGGRIGVILTVYQAFPSWSSGSTDPQAPPRDTSPDSPWAWFVEHLARRYRPHGPLAVDWLEPVNEPNGAYQPQDGIVDRTVEMVETAAGLSAAADGPGLLVPATSDAPDPGERHDPRKRTDWRSFTEQVAPRLAAARLPGRVAWAHHNYTDVEDGRSPSRVEEVLEILERAGWFRGRPRQIWLTEGGYVLRDPASGAEQAQQAALIERNFSRMRRLPEVRLWTQHGVNDVEGNRFKSALRDDFDGAGRQPGSPRPAWEVFAGLTGTRR